MAPRLTAVLLITCPDQPGLVATVSDFVYRHGGNILHADQHTDREEGVFLQRVEWEMRGFDLPREAIDAEFAPIARRFGMEWRLHFSDEVPRVAVFVSQLPHCLYDLLARWRMGEYQADFSLVVSNHETLRPVAESFGVPFEAYTLTKETKAAQERLILKRLQEERIDLVVLARYMQIVGPGIIGSYADRIINIHHSFLPAFAGARPYHQAHQRGVKIIGATAHYATEELDQGPIIEQDVVRISHRDSVADLVRKGSDLEKVVLARAVKLHLDRRVIVYRNKTAVFA
ncbi:MAG TPA: formyltetrahydrofolate deformylase [Dehalococcoidia bacterium]|nr:formyltetrahydrofolate deformylase [Dehalococcoidia bacterium]